MRFLAALSLAIQLACARVMIRHDPNTLDVVEDNSTSATQENVSPQPRLQDPSTKVLTHPWQQDQDRIKLLKELEMYHVWYDNCNARTADYESHNAKLQADLKTCQGPHLPAILKIEQMRAQLDEHYNNDQHQYEIIDTCDHWSVCNRGEMSGQMGALVPRNDIY